MQRPRSEDPHRREQNNFQLFWVVGPVVAIYRCIYFQPTGQAMDCSGGITDIVLIIISFKSESDKFIGLVTFF